MKRPPKVYVVNEPLVTRDGAGEMMRFMDLSSATRYGDLVFLLPSGPLPENPAPIISKLKEGLSDYSDDDYLLPIGDMRAIVWAAGIASEKADELKVLIWERDIRRYVMHAGRLDLAAAEPEPV